MTATNMKFTVALREVKYMYTVNAWDLAFHIGSLHTIRTCNNGPPMEVNWPSSPKSKGQISNPGFILIPIRYNMTI